MNASTQAETRRVLLTGATGYIGGRLAPRLLDAGYAVRCLVRDPVRAEGKPWADQVELVQGDVSRSETLPASLDGIQVAFYLVHSLARPSEDFVTEDVTAARNFGAAAREAGVERIIFLGQLGQPKPGEAESPYLEARHCAGEALRESGVPVTEFQAGVVVGSGSVTFEMIRYLTERWPVLICPLWAYTLGQPIAIRDVLSYLIGALETPASMGRTIPIGGPDTLTYAEMLLGYSVERGLARWMIPLHLMTPALSATWTRMITPISREVARPLIELLRANAVVTGEAAAALFPDIHPIPYHRAVRLAIERTDTRQVETAWSDALVTSMGEDGTPVVLGDTEGFYIERRERVIDASPAACYRAFTSLGGDTGWLFWDWTWRLRGWMDEVVGGVGLRRGRRHPTELAIGDAVDFWRVEVLEPDRLMRLRAEMRVPGGAWLECRVKPVAGGRSLLNITALFQPKGVGGFLYWWILYIPHVFIFTQMVKRIGQRAIGMEKTASRPSQGSMGQAADEPS
jgi:uncharacterized protein YbjT (DUF2867 family)